MDPHRMGGYRAKMVRKAGALEKRKMEEVHQRKVEKMIKSAEGECWTSPQNHKANDVKRSADSEGGRRREIVRSL